MRLTINVQARLERHARNMGALNRKHLFALLKQFRVFAIIISLILPIYPSFASLSSQDASAAADYDASTILMSYQGDSDDSNATLFSQSAGFIQPSSLINDQRDVSGLDHLFPYRVQAGDTISTIAAKFNVTASSIYWANDLASDSVLTIGMNLRIPPVSGVLYHVVAGDSIQMIADRYHVDSDRIIAQNHLDPKKDLQVGQDIIVPDAHPIVTPEALSAPVVAQAPAPTPVPAPTPKPKAEPKKVTKKVEAPAPDPTPAPKTQKYSIAYTGGGNGFAFGNCTYYVANHKHVTWRGNANQWLHNAAEAGVPTGSDPAIGAIVSFAGAGYNRYYGHVGIVVDIDDGDIIVKDMNYRAYNEVTVRRVSKDDPSIRGYIYAD